MLSFSGFFESLSAKQLRSTVSATSDEVAAAWMATDFASGAKLIENIRRLLAIVALLVNSYIVVI